MSAIWGFVDLRRSETAKNGDNIGIIASKMKQPYEKCAIDRFSEEFFDRGFFACGLQYFNSREKKEVLPLVDREKGYIFSADIVLNGRRKLIEELADITDISVEELESATDGKLAYLSFLAWNIEFTDHVTGQFAIAVYDLNSNEFYLFADHMGTRCVNYFCRDGLIFFSTLTEPINKAMPKEYYGINEKWIVACEADDSPQMIYYPGETPFENVYQVNRGCFVHVKKDDSENYAAVEVEYWNPSDLPRLKLDLGEYRELFRRTFFECVRDAIDTDENIAATISSGLDSTSVAGVAARELERQGRILYGFTMVPLSDYVSDYGYFDVVDETQGVNVFLDKYPQVVHEFDKCEGKSGLTELERLVDILEVPVKALRNTVWIDDIIKKAKDRDCRVFLIGQGGNETISSGHVLTRFYQELRGGRVLEAKRQLASYGAMHGITRKELFRVATRELTKKLLMDLNLSSEYKDFLDSKYIKGTLLDKYSISKLFKKQEKRLGNGFYKSEKKYHNVIIDRAILQNISIYNTKLGLYHGLAIKDPTNDKRLVELIFRFPPSEFYSDGVDRRLVREYLDDIVPDEIRLEFKRRGLQGADATYRLNHFGKEKLKNRISDDMWIYFLKDNSLKLLEKTEFKDDDTSDVLRMLSLNEFLIKEKSRM